MSSVEQVLAEIKTERWRQDNKFGEQNHPDGTSKDYKWLADSAREKCNSNAENGLVTWKNILQEEFYEALSETNQYLIRAELLQVAAVCVSWIQSIDRRNK